MPRRAGPGVHDVDGVAHVERVTPPGGQQRVGVERDGGVLGAEYLFCVASVRQRGCLRKHPAVRPTELEIAERQSFHVKAIFVYRAMVAVTEQDQVRQRRGPAARPMTNVVPLRES